MLIKVFKDKTTLGRAAPDQAATAMRRADSERGQARIIAATAASQLEFLDALTQAPDIEWSKVEAFHLDEYIGLPITHPGSFRKMLLEQLVNKTGIRRYHLLAGDAADPAAGVRETSAQLASAPIDIAFLGIGEILAVVPDTRKAQAVKACVEGEISPMAPASILRRHPNATIYLDTASASLLGPTLQEALRKASQASVT